MDPDLPLWLQSALAAPSPAGAGASFPAVPGATPSVGGVGAFSNPYSGSGSPYGVPAVTSALSNPGSNTVTPNTQSPQSTQQPSGNQGGGNNINPQLNSFGYQVGNLLGQTVQGQGPIYQGISSLFGGNGMNAGLSPGMMDPSMFGG